MQDINLLPQHVAKWSDVIAMQRPTAGDPGGQAVVGDLVARDNQIVARNSSTSFDVERSIDADAVVAFNPWGVTCEIRRVTSGGKTITIDAPANATAGPIIEIWDLIHDVRLFGAFPFETLAAAVGAPVKAQVQAAIDDSRKVVYWPAGFYSHSVKGIAGREYRGAGMFATKLINGDDTASSIHFDDTGAAVNIRLSGLDFDLNHPGGAIFAGGLRMSPADKDGHDISVDACRFTDSGTPGDDTSQGFVAQNCSRLSVHNSRFEGVQCKLAGGGGIMRGIQCIGNHSLNARRYGFTAVITAASLGPQAILQDVDISHNVIENSWGGALFAGRDGDSHVNCETHDITISHNHVKHGPDMRPAGGQRTINVVGGDTASTGIKVIGNTIRGAFTPEDPISTRAISVTFAGKGCEVTGNDVMADVSEDHLIVLDGESAVVSNNVLKGDGDGMDIRRIDALVVRDNVFDGEGLSSGGFKCQLIDNGNLVVSGNVFREMSNAAFTGSLEVLLTADNLDMRATIKDNVFSGGTAVNAIEVLDSSSSGSTLDGVVADNDLSGSQNGFGRREFTTVQYRNNRGFLMRRQWIHTEQTDASGNLFIDHLLASGPEWVNVTLLAGEPNQTKRVVLRSFDATRVVLKVVTSADGVGVVNEVHTVYLDVSDIFSLAQ